MFTTLAKHRFHELTKILLRDHCYCQPKFGTRLTIKLSDNLSNIVKLSDALRDDTFLSYPNIYAFNFLVFAQSAILCNSNNKTQYIVYLKGFKVLFYVLLLCNLTIRKSYLNTILFLFLRYLV